MSSTMANSELFVIAAAVRDGEEQILEYINSHPYDFAYVDGTKFFQSVYVPGHSITDTDRPEGRTF
jgi:hypothetical protein